MFAAIQNTSSLDAHIFYTFPLERAIKRSTGRQINSLVALQLQATYIVLTRTEIEYMLVCYFWYFFFREVWQISAVESDH